VGFSAVDALDAELLVPVLCLEPATTPGTASLDSEGFDVGPAGEGSGPHRADHLCAGVAQVVAVVGLGDELVGELLEVVVELGAVAHLDGVVQLGKGDGAVLGPPQRLQDVQSRLVCDDAEGLGRFDLGRVAGLVARSTHIRPVGRHTHKRSLNASFENPRISSSTGPVACVSDRPAYKKALCGFSR